LKGLRHSSDLDTNFSDLRRYGLGHILTKDAGLKSKYESDMAETYKDIEKNLAGYEPTIHKDENRRRFEDLKTAAAKYRGIHDRSLELSRAGKTAEAEALVMGDGRLAYSALNDILGKMVDYN